MSTYIIVYSNELNHHGVKGMKWGVRKAERYEKAANKWKQKEQNARFNFTRDYYSANRLNNQVRADNQRAANKEKSLKRKLQQKYGAEASARAGHANAEYYSLRAKNSKSRLGKHFNSIRAYNFKTAGDFYKKQASRSTKTLDRVIDGYERGMSRPVKSAILGKQSTVGREYVKGMIISAVGSTVSASANQALAEELLRRMG